MEDAIGNYRSRQVPEEAAGFARLVVARAVPKSASRAKALLWACSRLAAFGISVGLECEAEVLLHPSVIERLVVVGTKGMSGPARRTLRTDLRFVGASVLPGSGPSPLALPRDRSKAPYTGTEIAAYLALADAQPTEGRAMRSSGLVCLGAGAGLMGADLRHVSGTDVTSRSGGVIVRVKGRRPRVVPVLSRYHHRLVAAAEFAGAGLVIGGGSRQRKNVSGPLVSSLSGGADLARLDTGRLRATWLASCAHNLGLATFMAAAGVRYSQHLGDLLAMLPVAGEEEAVALLGGPP